MVISPRSVFFHIPKTGGSWVTKVLKEMGICEVDYRPHFRHILNLQAEHVTYRDIDKNRIKGKFSYAFVRDPVEWYRSFWKFRTAGGWDMRFILDRECKNVDFNKFVENVARVFPEGFVSSIYKEYLGHQLDQVDFVGKQENLKEDLEKALTLAGEVFSSERIKERKKFNVSNPPILKEKYQYKDDVLELIRRTERWAITKFKY